MFHTINRVTETTRAAAGGTRPANQSPRGPLAEARGGLQSRRRYGGDYFLGVAAGSAPPTVSAPLPANILSP